MFQLQCHHNLRRSKLCQQQWCSCLWSGYFQVSNGSGYFQVSNGSGYFLESNGSGYFQVSNGLLMSLIAELQTSLADFKMSGRSGLFWPLRSEPLFLTRVCIYYFDFKKEFSNFELKGHGEGKIMKRTILASISPVRVT